MRATPEARRLASVLYEYHRLHQTPRPAEAIVALGSNDIRVAHLAADLYRQGLAPVVVFSGGIAHLGDLLATGWNEPEAERFAAEAERRGVPRSAMLLEPRSTNTAENFRFVRTMIEPRSILVAVKTFMQRRAWATQQVVWPEVDAVFAAPDLSFDEFCAGGLSAEDTIDILVGDTQRLEVYGTRGWSARQELTPEARAAYESLIRLGFDRHLLAADPDLPHAK